MADTKRGRDAADMPPRFVPDEDLLPRDDSGGPGGPRYSGQWDDGGKVTKGSTKKND